MFSGVPFEGVTEEPIPKRVYKNRNKYIHVPSDGVEESTPRKTQPKYRKNNKKKKREKN